MPLIITEGELDAMTAIQCGFPLAVSVPDGAPPPLNAAPAGLVTSDADGKFKFCWNNRELIAGQAKRFILAVDNDPAGQRLADELVRRLLPSRCLFVEYPDGCKDLNDVLVNHGASAVAATLNAAKPYPVKGIYRFSEYPERPDLETFSTGWPILDRNFRLFPGEFCVITGIPSHGKSTFVLNLLCNVARIHGWRSAIFSPEMPAVPFVRSRLRAIYGDYRDPIAVSAFLEDRFVFIDADPHQSGEEADFTLEWMLDRATDAVMRDGVRVLVIDPWNEMEHARRQGESLTEYIGRAIKEIKRFAKLRQVVVIIVAHPTKDVWREGKSRTPSLYDIEGSAHWFNKADHGLVIERAPDKEGITNIHIAKSRFGEAGERGMVKMSYFSHAYRYEQLDSPADPQTGCPA
jgi:twinkle protein